MRFFTEGMWFFRGPAPLAWRHAMPAREGDRHVFRVAEARAGGDRGQLTPETAEVYSSVKHALKQAGTPIPTNDVWICAHALEVGAVVITDDAHFSHAPGVRVWTRDET